MKGSKVLAGITRRNLLCMVLLSGLTSVALAAAPNDAGQPRARIPLPLLTHEPTLDGNLDDPFWTQATRVSGFSACTVDVLAAQQATAYAAYTAKGLFFGFDINLAPGGSPRGLLTGRDSSIYTEDAVEVFLQPAGVDRREAYQLIASCLGTQFDAKIMFPKFDVSAYNPQWTVKTQGRVGGWTAEIFIPFAAVGVQGPPAPGTVWRGNFCIDRGSGSNNASMWAFWSGRFDDPNHFGDFLFTGSSRAIREADLQTFTASNSAVRLDLVGGFAPVITMTVEMTDAANKDVYKNAMLFRDTNSITFTPPSLTTGKYRLTLTGVDETGTNVFRQAFGIVSSKAFDFTVENYPFVGYMEMQVDARGLGSALDKVTFTLVDGTGRTMDTIDMKTFKAGTGTSQLSNKKLSHGVYRLKAQALNKAGKPLQTAERPLEIYPKPAWGTSTRGLDHSVPPPFTPIRSTPTGLAVWGREFTFDQSVFPHQIVNQKTAMFSRSPQFSLRAEGQAVDLAELPASKRDTGPDAVVLTGQGQAGKVAVAVKTTVEFDGFSRYDVTLNPTAPATVDQMVLTLAVPKGLAQWLLCSGGISSDIFHLSGEPRSFDFMPYIWLGNDSMGFCWFAESPQYWKTKAGEKLQFVTDHSQTAFKVNFISQPIKLTCPITFSFGLMATPIRPVIKNDPFAYSQHVDQGKVTFSENLVYPLPKEASPERGSLEFWVRRNEKTEPTAYRTNLFTIAGGKRSLNCVLLTPNQPDRLAVTLDGQDILTVPAKISTEGFAHLCLTWDQGALAVYLDGKRLGTALCKGTVLFERSSEDPDSLPRLVFGTEVERVGYTNMVVDEIRFSRMPRYTGESFGSPNGPFARDESTLLLDHLDETFQPDGQDAETAGGGIPTIGSRFVAAKFGQGLKLLVLPPRPALDVMKDFDCRIATHWQWTKDMAAGYGQPYFHAPLTDDIKEQVADYHRHGIPVIPYTAYPAVSSSSGLVERYGAEWGLRPVSTTPWPRPRLPEGYYLYNCCLGAESYRNYFAEYVSWVLDDLGFDGFYSDGITHMFACKNRAHGCGYIDDEGNLQATFPVFAVRDTIKRLYRIVKAKNPAFFVANHQSYNTLAPSLSFSDLVYTGEHEDYKNLTTARVRFNNSRWGLYFTEVGATDGGHRYTSLHTMVPLLHGTSVWGTGVSGLTGRNDIGRKNLAISRIYKNFDTTSAVWVPYYEGEHRFYEVADTGDKVSLYYHPKKDVLLLVANFKPMSRDVQVWLRLDQFGLAGRDVKAVNAWTHQKIGLAPDGTMTVGIKPVSFALIRVEKKKSESLQGNVCPSLSAKRK